MYWVCLCDGNHASIELTNQQAFSCVSLFVVHSLCMYVSNRKIVAEKCNGNPNEREAFHLATEEVRNMDFVVVAVATVFFLCFYV